MLCLQYVCNQHGLLGETIEGESFSPFFTSSRKVTEERRRSLSACWCTQFPMMSRDGVLHRVLEFGIQVFYHAINWSK